MSSIVVGNTISFDHTFKVATNIGYHREDKVWVSQYDNLFLVVNSNGQIVTWQLTKGTAIDQVDTVRCFRAQQATKASNQICLHR